MKLARPPHHQIRNLPELETADPDVNITDDSQGSPGFFVRDIRLTQEMFLKQSLGGGCVHTLAFWVAALGCTQRQSKVER